MSQDDVKATEKKVTSLKKMFPEKKHTITFKIYCCLTFSTTKSLMQNVHLNYLFSFSISIKAKMETMQLFYLEYICMYILCLKTSKIIIYTI